MLKKWISSGDAQHARICDGGDHCQGNVYHGGTGLLFDFMLCQEEDLRAAYPERFAAHLPPEFYKGHTGYMSTHKGSISVGRSTHYKETKLATRPPLLKVVK